MKFALIYHRIIKFILVIFSIVRRTTIKKYIDTIVLVHMTFDCDYFFTTN